MIFGDRVSQAREISGLTQVELASRVGVEQAFISMIEGGRREPSNAVLEAIAFQTGFPPQFFRQPPTAELPEGSLRFRRLKSASRTELAQARQYARLVLQLVLQLDEHFKTRAVKVPLTNAPDPVAAAKEVRRKLGAPSNQPIKNLTSLLERAGVVFLPIRSKAGPCDAFSAWVPAAANYPAIAYWIGAPGDRERFSRSHELGHLTMHVNSTKPTDTLEKEADLFAGEFLIPGDALEKELSVPLNIGNLMAMKRRWGMSMQAIVMTAAARGVISERQKQRFFAQISKRGWRKHEPVPVPSEKPRLLAQMAEMLWGPELAVSEVATLGAIPRHVAAELLSNFGSSHDVKRSRAEADVGSDGSVVPFARKATE